MRSARAWAGFFLAVFLVIYLPGLGHGLIRDDYEWIRGSRVGAWRELPDLFARHNGFYRPLVGLTFLLDERAFGLDALGYGLTNLAFVLADVALIAVLARRIGLAPPLALLAAFLWAFNPHGINMAVLWTSGRTSLLLVLFALMSALAFWRRNTALAALFFLCALFSKEEALLLPATLFCWGFMQERAAGAPAPARAAALRLWPLLPCAGFYLWLRGRTGAFTPASAPYFYKPSLDLTVLAGNVIEYADRACTFVLAIVLLVALAARALPKPDARERLVIALGVAWLVFGYAITVFLPVRSSLYACFPSIGAAFAGSGLVSASVRALDDVARRRLLLASAVAMAVSVPIYWSRNARWIEPAKVAGAALRDAAPLARDASLDVLVLQDEPGTRNNLSGAFGTLVQDAVRLASGRPELRVWLEPPPPGWREVGLRPPREGESRRTLRLTQGRLVEVTAPAEPAR